MEILQEEFPRDSQRGAEIHVGLERRQRGYSIDQLIDAANVTFSTSNEIFLAEGSENSCKNADYSLSISKVEVVSPPETKKRPNPRRSRSATFSYSPFAPPESSFALVHDDDNEAGGATSGIRTLSWLASMADDEVSAAKFLSDLCRQPNTPASTSVGTRATTRLPFSSLSPLRKTARVILTDKVDLERNGMVMSQSSGNHQRFSGLRFGLGFDDTAADSDFGNLSDQHESDLIRKSTGAVSEGTVKYIRAGSNVGECDEASYDPSAARKDVSPSEVVTYWDGVSASIHRSQQRPRERSYSVSDLSFRKDDVERMVGAYTAEERRRRIERFLHKRSRRVWVKKVKYDVRKNFADSRVRVRGRFIRKVEGEAGEIFTEHDENVAVSFDDHMT